MLSERALRWYFGTRIVGQVNNLVSTIKGLQGAVSLRTLASKQAEIDLLL